MANTSLEEAADGGGRKPECSCNLAEKGGGRPGEFPLALGHPSPKKTSVAVAPRESNGTTAHGTEALGAVISCRLGKDHEAASDGLGRYVTAAPSNVHGTFPVCFLQTNAGGIAVADGRMAQWPPS
jgi:hypothetical protein